MFHNQSGEGVAEMGFRKAEPKQAVIKMSVYGPPGSGKTFSTLLFAEGIAKRMNKRIAFVDTERGTDFYAMKVADREAHPEAFDFDAIYTRSITEVVKDCRALNPDEHGVIIIDSISHLWDACIASYTGTKTSAGTIPMWAWSKIKQPYKELMKFLIDSQFHVFILGRQSNVFEEDSTTGESKAAGVKMRAEGETAYEPHICLRMIPQRTEKKGNKTVIHREQVIAALAEKDRTGILAGKLIQWPDFNSVVAPILGILKGEQGRAPSDEDAAAQDAEALQNAERNKASSSKELTRKYLARFQLAEDTIELEKIGKELTPTVKRGFSAVDLTEVRTAYLVREKQLRNGHEENQDAEPPPEAATVSA